MAEKRATIFVSSPVCAPLSKKQKTSSVFDYSKFETHFNFDDVRLTTDSEWKLAIVAVCSEVGRASLRSLKMSVDLPMSAPTLNSIFRSCPNLERVSVFMSNDRSELAAVRFDELEKLKEIQLLGCERNVENRGVTDGQPLPATLQALTGLRCLRAEDADGLLDFLVTHPKLKHFEISESAQALAGGTQKFSLFELIADQCGEIERLAVVNCWPAPLRGIELLADLKELKISNDNDHLGDFIPYSSVLTDEQILTICHRNPHLESLRIAGRDQCLTSLACEAIAGLREPYELEMSGVRFRLPGAERFDDASFATILFGVGASLRRLSLWEPYQLTDTSIDAVAELFPKLRLLIVREGAFSANAYSRLIRKIVMPTSFDRTKETFELFIDWQGEVGGYDWLISYWASSRGVVVRRFYRAGVLLADTMVPI